MSGGVLLTGDSAVEFGSGQITSVTKVLLLDGNNAFIEDSTALGSNSALTGLASIGGFAELDLENGASVSTTGALTSHGTVTVGVGSSLTAAGALTNSGSLGISGNVTATSLDNTGDIGLGGSSANQALLDVTGSAGFGTAGVLSGYVFLGGDSAVEFASGQITSLADGAEFVLYGNAFIEDSTALGSNSALTGLASISAGAQLYLENGASVSTTGALVNDGTVSISGNMYALGSSLTVAGTLTDTGTLDIGSRYLSSSDSVTANSFVNSGTVGLTGNGPNLATLDVSGTTTNNGSISIASDTEQLAGAVSGAGSFSLSNANLQFDSSVSFGQTIKETGEDDALTLKQAQSFAATISGFGTGDTIDATNFVETATSYSFLENSMGTGGTLTLTDTSRESDRQYPDDRRLFEQEFHPRPRQRDRHAGEVRLSGRRARQTG